LPELLNVLLITLTRNFDGYRSLLLSQVVGPKSQQRSIYEHAVAPIVNDVLKGYNCTVFAFGQTGTGKTYTMEGEMRQKVLYIFGHLPRGCLELLNNLSRLILGW
jgi:hypothetical protein